MLPYQCAAGDAVSAEEKMEKTWNDLVREVAADFGIVPDDAECGRVLRNYTGFPAFWRGDPETCCREQLRTFFADPEGTARRIDAEMEAGSAAAETT
jgi:hypothetical protein